MTRIGRGRLAVAVAIGGLWLACGVIDAQPFIAGQYIPSLDCVTPGEVIDVLSGLPGDASCEASCIIPLFDSGVYVTGACPPFPPGDLVNPDAALCTKALAAIRRSDLCLDSGPSNPATDSGHDAAATRDAPLDGPLDAGRDAPDSATTPQG